MEYDGVIMSKYTNGKDIITTVDVTIVMGPNWMYDLCEDLPELKQYDCLDDLYDELGEYE